MPGGQAAALTPSRLVIARKRRGLTLTQLAGLTGLSTRSISLYENGHTEPSADTLRQLAEALDVSTGFLGAPDVDEIPEDAVSFRALSKMTARQRDRALSAGRVALLINDWIDARFRLPDTDIPGLTGHDPESAAEVVRAHWGLGERPVSNVLHLLESRGARIYSLTPENTELDAFSLYWQGRPFIFLATGKTGERGRFDAAHELGHLVLHGGHQVPSRPAAEAEANRFAAAFLMPRASVLAQSLRDATPAQILEAKRIWKVSAMALTHRLHELDLLTEWGYRTACVQLSRLGYRYGEPRGIERESSQLLAKVFRAIRDGGETPATIASSIGISTSELRSHVFGLTLTSVPGDGQPVTTPPRHGLRLVPPPRADADLPGIASATRARGAGDELAWAPVRSEVPLSRLGRLPRFPCGSRAARRGRRPGSPAGRASASSAAAACWRVLAGARHPGGDEPGHDRRRERRAAPLRHAVEVPDSGPAYGATWQLYLPVA